MAKNGGATHAHIGCGTRTQIDTGTRNDDQRAIASARESGEQQIRVKIRAAAVETQVGTTAKVTGGHGWSRSHTDG